MKTSTAALLATLVFAGSMRAADRQQVRAINIGAQAVLTLVSGAIQGRVHTLKDVARCLGSGAAAGYGTYEAKILVSKGDVQSGWILANLATSVSENTAAGKHPLAQLGYTIGPIRIRFAIPRLDRGGDAYAYVDFSEYQAIALVRSYQENDRMRWRSGMVAFERDTLYPVKDGVGPFVGTAWGVYPAVWIRARRDTWHHEVIHAIQSLQGEAVEPSLPILTYAPKPRPDGSRRIVRFEHLKLGVVNFSSDLLNEGKSYKDRWTEIEAYRVAQDREP